MRSRRNRKGSSDGAALLGAIMRARNAGSAHKAFMVADSGTRAAGSFHLTARPAARVGSIATTLQALEQTSWPAITAFLPADPVSTMGFPQAPRRRAADMAMKLGWMEPA